MRKHLFAVMAVGTAGILALTACGSDSSSAGSSGGASAGSGSAEGGKVGVILPDTASSARYETLDRPLLKKAFDAAGIEADIQNAGGDVSKFQAIADSMISAGVDVLLIDNLDNGSGTAVIKKATNAGIPVIDYDRLTLGGGASYYVSFDNVAVGTAIGNGLIECMKANGDDDGPVVELNGSPDDNNATLFKEGYDKALKDAGYTVAASQAVQKWDPNTGGKNFQQIDTKLGGKYVGVAAANDGLAGAVVARLKADGTAGKVPVSGQDATTEGLQRVLLGTQCNTIYKAVSKEAEAAAKLAISLIKQDKSGADSQASGTTKDTTLNKDVPSVLLEPQNITAETVKDVVADGAASADDICKDAELKKACEKYGVS
ncbi:sugar ABC transporter substrate-binding protein [Kineosporia succinea]|uniref:D-xylose transport system substrate-binding protein n=1 Tax=Kineosporia succinea TaxID=84632 RepID=A0ABT9NWY8_9ACTN|nr:substrate-binding domain-containing protein [Kineosporia succinea]MDP9824520.1 D-xylose transport system substrate-binding protein [Kineosporia succinea]